MARNIVKAKLDVIFKKMFTDAKNENFLKCFISDILDIPYDDIEHMAIENSEITPEEIDGKFTRFDLRLTVNNSLVNVEVQMSNRNDFPARSLYYWAQIYGNQLKKGESYSDLRPTISINIVNYSIFQTDDYYSKFTMADLEHGTVLTNKCAIHYFELSKINRKPDSADRKKLWMQLINSESEEELDMLNKTQVPAIQQGVSIIREMSEDERTREMERRREDALREEISALEYVGQQKKAEGIAEGEAKKEIQVARNLRRLGFSEDIIQAAISD
ncbi:MAG: Rpn family recombination-promoting nuclease/putative transposase [Clostridiales bacterium]|nr:Rpn family recombination-promoting nuclease/putative transposase [Clostridiales bacterium]